MDERESPVERAKDVEFMWEIAACSMQRVAVWRACYG
jgi:hypothetical protein